MTQLNQITIIITYKSDEIIYKFIKYQKNKSCCCRKFEEYKIKEKLRKRFKNTKFI